VGAQNKRHGVYSSAAPYRASSARIAYACIAGLAPYRGGAVSPLAAGSNQQRQHKSRGYRHRRHQARAARWLGGIMTACTSRAARGVAANIGVAHLARTAYNGNAHAWRWRLA